VRVWPGDLRQACPKPRRQFAGKIPHAAVVDRHQQAAPAGTVVQDEGSIGVDQGDRQVGQRFRVAAFKHGHRHGMPTSIDPILDPLNRQVGTAQTDEYKRDLIACLPRLRDEPQSAVTGQCRLDREAFALFQQGRSALKGKNAGAFLIETPAYPGKIGGDIVGVDDRNPCRDAPRDQGRLPRSVRSGNNPQLRPQCSGSATELVRKPFSVNGHQLLAPVRIDPDDMAGRRVIARDMDRSARRENLARRAVVVLGDLTLEFRLEGVDVDSLHALTSLAGRKVIGSIGAKRHPEDRLKRRRRHEERRRGGIARPEESSRSAPTVGGVPALEQRIRARGHRVGQHLKSGGAGR